VIREVEICLEVKGFTMLKFPKKRKVHHLILIFCLSFLVLDFDGIVTTALNFIDFNCIFVNEVLDGLFLNIGIELIGLEDMSAPSCSCCVRSVIIDVSSFGFWHMNFSLNKN